MTSKDRAQDRHARRAVLVRERAGDERMWERVDEAAKKLGWTRSHWIRWAIQHALDYGDK